MSNTSKTNNSLPLRQQRGGLGCFCFCNTQSYNRYSYVQNNLLKYTDPSGWILKAAPEKVIGDDLSGGGGGGGSRGNIGYIGDLNSITGMGSFGYNYMGPYSAYASNPGGYAATYGTTANWVTSVHQSSSASMPNWDKGNPSTMYHIAKQTIIDINTFNASTRSNTIIPRIGNNEYNGISWNTATACENCGGIGANTNTSNAGFFNNTLNYVNNHKLDIIGTFGGAAEYELGRRLSKPINIYQKIRLATPRWSKYSSKIEPFASEYLTLSKYTKGLKWDGGVLGAIGMGSSFISILDGYKQHNTSMMFENSLDLIMGGVGFIPVWGWAASGTYFLIAKPLYNNYISKEDTP